MSKEDPQIVRALVKLPDGTVKQKNQLTGTEVWTVPGRGHRPLVKPQAAPLPIAKEQHTDQCAFCSSRYLETPPEKERLLLGCSALPRPKETTLAGGRLWAGLGANELFDTVADFRRIPNLFEIVSYQYWNLNYGHQPSPEQHQRMAEYLSTPAGYDHIIGVMKSKMQASGLTPDDLSAMTDPELIGQANGFFSGGHDLIVGRRHYIDGATNSNQLASSGTLTPEEHYAYTAFTIHAIQDLYRLNPNVAYVSAFQNWLKPAGASFDHLHKQIVAIDEIPVQIKQEKDRVRKDPDIYKNILEIRATRKLILAQNEYAVAMAGIGHRYPTIAIWPLGPALRPWEAGPEQVRAVSDLLHAIHAATGAEVPCNEEWYHCPPTVDTPMRWRVLVKWRISTLAGFEGGTRIYLNTIDPWTIYQRLLPKLQELQEKGKIAKNISLGSETKINPTLLA